MFINSKHKENIEELGFYKLELLESSTIEQLKILFANNFENKLNSVDMTVTHNGNDREEAISIHQKISALVRDNLDKHFANYEIFASHFSVKKAHSETAFQLHQDWNIVDENKYKNYQIWIPLDISYPENGGMCFIPESHKFFNNFRSGSLGIPHIPIDEDLHPYLAHSRLIPTEGLVFFNNTFHGSFINSTAQQRVAVIINIVEKNAPTYYFHKNEQNQINAYQLDSSGLFKHLPQLERGEMPLTQLVKNNLEHHQIENEKIDKYLLIDKIHESNRAKNRALDYEHKLFHILKDKNLEAEINHLGFSIVNLIDDEKVKKIQAFFNDIFGEDRSKYASSYSSVSNASAPDRRKIHDYIKNLIHEELSELFVDFKVGITLFYSRRPDKNYFLDWHSDPSIVLNEQSEPVYGFWCPLVDIDEKSGGFLIVPGSHRMSNKLNGSFQTWDWDFNDERRMLDKYGVGFNLKAGEALIFDTRIVHASKPNFSEVERDNFVVRILQKDTKFINIHYKGNNEGILFTQDEDYFIDDTVLRHNEIPEKGNIIGPYFMFKPTYERENLIKMLEEIDLPKFEKANPNKIFFSHR